MHGQHHVHGRGDRLAQLPLADPGLEQVVEAVNDFLVEKEGEGDMMSSPSQSSVGRLLSGSSATSSSYVHRRFFHLAGMGLGLAAITAQNEPLNRHAVKPRLGLKSARG